MTPFLLLLPLPLPEQSPPHHTSWLSSSVDSWSSLMHCQREISPLASPTRSSRPPSHTRTHVIGLWCGPLKTLNSFSCLTRVPQSHPPPPDLSPGDGPRLSPGLPRTSAPLLALSFRLVKDTRCDPDRGVDGGARLSHRIPHKSTSPLSWPVAATTPPWSSSSTHQTHYQGKTRGGGEGGSRISRWRSLHEVRDKSRRPLPSAWAFAFDAKNPKRSAEDPRTK